MIFAKGDLIRLPKTFVNVFNVEYEGFILSTNKKYRTIRVSVKSKETGNLSTHYFSEEELLYSNKDMLYADGLDNWV